MKEEHLPQPITNGEIIMDFRYKQLIEEQKKTNELLASLVSLLQPKKPTRKKKGDEEE